MIRMTQTIRKSAGDWKLAGFRLMPNGKRVEFTLQADSIDQVWARMRRMQEVINELHPRGKHGNEK